MKFVLFLICGCCLGFYPSFCQKTPIDQKSYSSWPSLGHPLISPDAKYVMYSIKGAKDIDSLLVIQAVANRWQLKEIGGRPEMFLRSLPIAIYMKADTLVLLDLAKKSKRIFSGVSRYSMADLATDPVLILKTESKSNELLVIKLLSGKEKVLERVKNFKLIGVDKLLVVQERGDSCSQLSIIDLFGFTQSCIWEGEHIADIVVSDKSHIAFSCRTSKRGVDEKKTFYWYDSKSRIVKQLMCDSFKEDDEYLAVESLLGFNKSSNTLFFNCRKNVSMGINVGLSLVPLNIWSYKDLKIQSQQLEDTYIPPYIYGVQITTGNIFRIQGENEQILNILNPDPKQRDDFLPLMANNGGDPSEHWREGTQRRTYLLSTSDGSRFEVPGNGLNNGYISPDNKFYVYYDFSDENYYSYEIKSRIKRNITKRIDVRWTSHLNALDKRGYLLRYLGWLEGDSAVLLHDEYDVWQVDPLGVKHPLRLTGGVGQKEKIFFESISENPLVARNGDTIILSGFNKRTKENGFFSVVIGRSASLRKLSGGQYYQFAKFGSSGSFRGVNFSPIKAMDANGYLVRRMSDVFFPNYFFTSDFVHFWQITNLQPQKDYNWYTAELHGWKNQLFGDVQGLLYKPENFDPAKKYPVIVNFYEIRSDMKNAYLLPAPSDGDLNICWYASNGYLVFSPDIHYKFGDPLEQGTYECIMSAVNYLIKLPFVDSTKIGLQGISWGGIQTNYMLTKTGVFAAACSSSGMSDFISAYNGLAHGNSSAQPIFDNGRFGFSIWERPDWFIKNSPVVNADKITTPLLLFHTTKDHATRFEQALELFNALRRLKKKVWLLEYLDGDHGVWGESALDFDIRMQQFFNYYLKNENPPKWMTLGRPASMRMKDSFLEIDTSGRVP